MKEIPLTMGKVALIDDEDYFWVSRHNWHYAKKKKDGKLGYAKRARKVKGKTSFVRLHRAIIAAPIHLQVDHIDGNPLNNQKSNLRLCTNKNNSTNSDTKRGKSGFKGVSWHKGMGGWRVRVRKDNKELQVGYFKCPIEAAKAYDAAAIEQYGEYARTNKMLGLI